jgi:hypothetical protein
MSTGFIPVSGTAIPNTHGSPNQGAFIPTGPMPGVPSGYITSSHGEKGHHTVVHPVIIQQVPAPAPAPIFIQQPPPPAPAPVVVAAPPAAQQPQQQQPINIKIQNVSPQDQQQQQQQQAAAMQPQAQQQQQTISSTTTTQTAPAIPTRPGGSVYDPANGATVTTAGQAGPIPRQTNTTTTTTSSVTR